MKRRVFVLPLSAAVIAGLCAYKLSRSDEETAANRPVTIVRQAPMFELYDQRKPPQVVQLKSFLGRHEVVLVFFDEKRGLSDPVFDWLKEQGDRLHRRRVKVLAISRGLPQDHRRMLKEAFLDGEEIPLQMLSDLDGKAHADYGLKEGTEISLPKVFIIDRAGNLPWNHAHPLPVADPVSELERRSAK